MSVVYNNELIGGEENTEITNTGRVKRSAAIHSKNAWQSLVKNLHIKKDDEISDEIDESSFQRSTKNKSVALTSSSKKRSKGFIKTNNDALEIETGSELTQKKTKYALEKNSPTKEQKDTKEVQSLNNEQKEKADASILPKNLPIMSKIPAISSHNTTNDGKPKIYRGSQILLPSSGALSKKDLEKIEREVDKHQLSASQEAAADHDFDEDEDDEDEEEVEKIKLDDLDDLDYDEPLSRSLKRAAASKRSYKKRDSADLSTTPRPNRYIPRGTKRGRPSNSASNVSSTSINGCVLPPQLRKIGDDSNKVIILNPNNGNNQMPSLSYTGSYLPPQYRSREGEFIRNENRTLKVIRIRSANNPINSSGSIPVSHLNMQRQNQMIPSVSYNDMVLSINKEINELSEKYQQRIIPESSVQHFNEIIDQITDELRRVLEDKARMIANHRDYVDNLNMSHAAQLDLKDKKIQQLEENVETLQSKLNVTFKRIQLNALKNETVVGTNVSNGNVSQSSKKVDEKIDGYMFSECRL